MKIRKWISITAITLFIAILAVGCGKTLSEEMNTMSENTESPVESVAKEEEIRTYNYANSSNYYGMDYYDEFGFYGYKKDGSGQTKYPVENFHGLLLVTEDAVYYSRGRDKKGKVDLLCQVPIKKGADETDVLDMKEEIILLEESDGIMNSTTPSIYVDEDYIVYLTYGKSEQIESEQLVRFNRRTKEITRYTPCDNQVTQLAYAGDGILVLFSMYGGFFRMDVASGEIVRFDGSDTFDELIYSNWEAYKEQFIYDIDYNVIDSDDQLWIYNVQNGEKKLFLDAKDLYQICGEQVQTEQGEQKITYLDFEQLFHYGDTIYIQCIVRWDVDEKEYCRYMMFSMDLSQETWEAKYEKEFTECMWEHCFEDYDDENEEYLNSGRCNAVVEGKAFLVLNEKGKMEQQVGCYDLEDGSFQILEKGMEEYVMPFFDNLAPYGDDEWELETWLGGIY